MTQIDLLNNEIAELIRVRDEMEVKLQTTNSTPEQNAIQNNIDGLNKTIGEKQAQLADQEKIEEKVNADVPFTISGVDLDPIPPEFIAIIKDIVIADRRLRLAEHAIELEEAENKYKELQDMYDSDKVNYELMQEKLQECEKVGVERGQEIDRLNYELISMTAKCEDIQRNRDNAATLLDEANQEIARLKSEIDDYQKAKVYGERQAQSIIDVTPNEAEEINVKIKKLFTKVEDWGSVIKAIKPDGTFEIVKRDELKDEWAPEVPAYQGGSESNESFRDEDTQTDVADGGLSYPEAPSLNLQFPEGEETGTGGLDGNSDIPEVVGETVTRAEFEQLRKNVEMIKQYVGYPEEIGKGSAA